MDSVNQDKYGKDAFCIIASVEQPLYGILVLSLRLSKPSEGDDNERGSYLKKLEIFILIEINIEVTDILYA